MSRGNGEVLKKIQAEAKKLKSKNKNLEHKESVKQASINLRKKGVIGKKKSK